MDVVCISDTHTFGSSVAVPPGDMLIHAGDLTMRGTESELAAELAWLDALAHPTKIVVAGNHDWALDPAMPPAFHGWALERTQPTAEFLARFPTLTYLFDEPLAARGYRIYGSPWQPHFHGWAFNFPADDGAAAARTAWAAIPDDVEILVTHGPPRGILDTAEPSGDAAGCPWLAQRVGELAHLRLHVFGHIHEAYGLLRSERSAAVPRTFVNASICTRRYKATNAPVVVTLPDRFAG